MHNANVKSPAPALRLFPRLALTKAARKTRRPDNPTTGGCHKTPVSAGKHESDRAQVRARLLRMILNNEQVRRNGQRPNAS